MAARRQWLAEHGIQPRHYQTNSTLTVMSEGHVRGRTMILVTHQRSGESAPMVAHTGIYNDEFRNTADAGDSLGAPPSSTTTDRNKWELPSEPLGGAAPKATGPRPESQPQVRRRKDSASL